MHDHNKEHFTLDVVSAIDEDIIDKNLKKRFELWFKKGKRKTIRWAPIVAAAACLCILISALAILLPGGNDKQIPVYRGMTISNDAPVIEQAQAPVIYPTFSLLSTSTLPPYDISLLDQDDTPDQNEPNVGQGNYDNAPDIVFGQTYYAMKNEDIYIHIHLSNPDEFEILSFTLNGKKYSSNMFEYGSDLQTLILKYNVGDVDGLQEYTIDAIKYVDGEKIKDVRMEGDKTVKVLVNDEKDLLQFNAQLSFTTLTIAPTKPLLSLALYEGDTLLRTLAPSDTTIADLPFDKRLILKATYSDGTQTREAQHIFDTQKLSQGLIIDAGGVIRGMGSCIDTELYINNPIGEEAFSGIKSIVEVYMGPGVTSIGNKAFYECSALSTVRLADTLTEMGSEAFSYSGITAISIPSSVKSLPTRIFQYCEKLFEVTLPENITVISERAFESCSSLVHINIPNNITAIEESAFFNCSSLTNILLPNTLTSIGKNAFMNCTSLSSIKLPDSLTTINASIFNGCRALTNVTLPTNLKKIEGRAFLATTGVTELVIPGSLVTITEWAFNGTHDQTFLRSITIMHGVKTIEWAALADHYDLVKVVLPASITSIGQAALNECHSLKELYFEGTMAQWNSITKDPRWKGTSPITVVHCSDGDIPI
jgi:hypothetical protein